MGLWEILENALRMALTIILRRPNLCGPMKLLYTGSFIRPVLRFNIVSVWPDEASVHR